MQKRRKKILLITILVLVISFAALTIFIAVFPESYIDHKFSYKVQQYQHPWLDGIMKVISWPGYVVVAASLVLITSFIFRLFGYKKEAIFTLFTLLSGAVSSIAKMLVNRPRPGADMVRVIEETRQQSFPSGHTQFYVIFFGFIIVQMLTLKQIPHTIRYSVITICSLLILSVPFSRIYLGAHWFTDIVGGFLLGLICLTTLSYFYLRKTGNKV